MSAGALLENISASAASIPQGERRGHNRSYHSGSTHRGAHHRVAVKPLRELYLDECAHYNAHPNSVVLKTLPDTTVGGMGGGANFMMIGSNAITELDFSRNYLGDRGLLPLLAVINRIPTLKSLNLSENGLRNNAVISLCTAVLVKPHPSLTTIDLSHNYISKGAATALINMLRHTSMQHFGASNAVGELEGGVATVGRGSQPSPAHAYSPPPQHSSKITDIILINTKIDVDDRLRIKDMLSSRGATGVGVEPE